MPTGNRVKWIGESLVYPSPPPEMTFAQTGKYHVRMEAGLDPYVFHAPVHIDDAATFVDIISDAKFTNYPLAFGKLEFTTSDHTDSGTHTFDWDGWFITEIVPDPELDNMFLVGLADWREAFRYLKITKKYNLYKDNGEADADSLNSGSDWTVGAYIQDIVDEINSEMGGNGFPGDLAYGGALNMSSPAVLNEDLPRNLSNTQTRMGGWVAATVKECLEPVMRAFGLTFYVWNKTLYVSDTKSGRSDIFALVTGDIATQQSYYRSDINVDFSKPKQVDVVFEAKREVALETPPRSASTWYGLVLENVLRLPAEFGSATAEYDWAELITEFATSDAVKNSGRTPSGFINDPEKYIADNYFYDPEIFPYRFDNNGLLEVGSEVEDYLNAEVAASARRAFRVVFEDDDYVNLRLGRLTEDGGTKSGGNVQCDYTIVRRRGKVEGVPSPGRHVISSVRWTEDFEITDYENQPAPFMAFWADSVQRILRIAPTNVNQLIVKDVVPGTMSVHLQIGDPVHMIIDGDTMQEPPPADLVLNKPKGKLNRDYVLRVIGNASPLDNDDRVHVITKDVFPITGMVHKQRLKAYGVTANYNFTDAELSEERLYNTKATNLMNPSELDAIAARVADEVKNSYEQNAMGAVKVGGIEPLVGASPVLAGGECNEMWIEVGFETNFSITTNYSIKPGVIEITVGRVRLDGEKVKVAL
jgi:hypothetical protein